jgi:hypothetical protein
MKTVQSCQNAKIEGFHMQLLISHLPQQLDGADNNGWSMPPKVNAANPMGEIRYNYASQGMFCGYRRSSLWRMV